jgi:polar amino acid transport system substrate-binding protein
MKKWAILLLGIGLVTSCQNYPQDPDDTLAKVKNGQLLVGYSVNPPWVIKTQTEPTGLEADLIKDFARTQKAKVIWYHDSEQDLFEKLHKRELHLVIAGLTHKNSWASKISFSKPYLINGNKKHVVAVLKGENAFVLSLEKFMHEQEPKLKAAAGL